MKTASSLGIALFLALTLAGCGGKPAQEAGSSSAPAPTPATSAGDWVAPADLDQGPRASETPVDAALAAQGETLFQSKGCSACHGFGKRMSGPDLKGVPQQRTARWMEAQILHPEKMTKQDPVSKALFAQFALQMPNQGLTPEQAKAVIEYIKRMSR